VIAARKRSKIRIGKRIETVSIHRLTPAVLNDKVYKPIDSNDPAIIALAKDIAEKGVLDPLVVTTDNVIVSGHRRYTAAEEARCAKVPVRRLNISSDHPQFAEYLVSFNSQRVKTPIEQIREEVVRTSPDDAHNSLLIRQDHETAQAYKRIEGNGFRILNGKSARRRSAISDAKRPMLQAAIAVVEQYQNYWPLTLRQIHYRLLGKGVLRNAEHSDSTYINTEQCYKDLSNLLTRARIAGELPWEAMHDPTRPHTSWVGYDAVGQYIRRELDGFLCGYHRNLLRGQSAYIELVVEKITVQEIAERAAGRFHVPVGVGRGYSSVTSLEETAERFRACGKDTFILLIAGDLDPEGEDISATWAACLRDEHGVENLTPVKLGVNPDQVVAYNFSPLPIKEKSSRAAVFQAKYGKDVYELESFEPDILQDIFRNGIRGALDLEAFAAEQQRQAEDARVIGAVRKQVIDLLKDCDFSQLT
jgi:hypothetical protein